MTNAEQKALIALDDFYRKKIFPALLAFDLALCSDLSSEYNELIFRVNPKMPTLYDQGPIWVEVRRGETLPAHFQ